MEKLPFIKICKLVVVSTVSLSAKILLLSYALGEAIRFECRCNGVTGELNELCWGLFYHFLMGIVYF